MNKKERIKKKKYLKGIKEFFKFIGSRTRKSEILEYYQILLNRGEKFLKFDLTDIEEYQQLKYTPKKRPNEFFKD